MEVKHFHLHHQQDNKIQLVREFLVHHLLEMEMDLMYRLGMLQDL